MTHVLAAAWPRARTPWPLLAITLVGWPGLLALFLGLPLSPWIGPLGLVVVTLLVRPLTNPRRPPQPFGLGVPLLTLLIAASALAIAWGCLATPERSWDGFATWGLTMRHLLAGEGLAAPYFADPAVFHYARGYPLLQPVLMQQLGCWGGADAARLFPVAAWLALLHAVHTGTAAGTSSRHARHLALAGIALVPMFVEPGHGSAESGFADLLLTAVLAYGARALLADERGTALCVGLLLPVTKNEGALHLALWLGLACAHRRDHAARGLLLGGALSLAAWLPVHHRLLHPGEAGGVPLTAWTPLLLPLAAAAAGRVVARFGARALLLLLALPALAAALLPTQLQHLLGGSFTATTIEWSALPHVLADFAAQAAWLRRFGTTFVLVALVAWRAWLHRSPTPAGPSAWQRGGPLVTALGLFALAIVGLLLCVPSGNRDLLLREGLARYLAQCSGVAWITIGVMLSLGHGAIPAHDRLTRGLWIVWVTLRKLREGPGPWLRAVRKGLVELLPRTLRRRLVGDDEAPGASVRYELPPTPAGGDAGIDTPGRISVVLPVYRQAHLLAASIDSVLAQSHRDLELLVVDDGSGDDVRAVLARYRDDGRVRVLTGPNQGLPKALSTGFRAATGEFCTWTSADNVMLPEHLARLAAFLRARPDVAMVYADYELIDDRGELLTGGEFRVMDRTDPHRHAVVRCKRDPAELNRYEDNFVGACFLYRGRAARLLGDYTPELGLEDYDYWMRMNRLFVLRHLGSDDVLYRYRVHDDTLSARARELRTMQRARALMAHERRRAAWCRGPLRVLASDVHARWLAGCVQAPDRLDELPTDGPTAAQAAAAANRPLLLVVDGDQLPTWLANAEALPSNVAVAAFFARAASVGVAAAALRRLPLLALAADGDVAAHLHVLSRTVVTATPGAPAFALAQRFAVDTTFGRTTLTPEQRRLQAPRALFAPNESPLRVRLQVAAATAARSAIARTLAAALDGAGAQVVAADDEAAHVHVTIGVPTRPLALGSGVPVLWIDDADGVAATAAAAVCVVAATPRALAGFARDGGDVTRLVVLDDEADLGRQLLLLFGWLRQGGAPAGVRDLLRHVPNAP